jgi:hypothetical protein
MAAQSDRADRPELRPRYAGRAYIRTFVALVLPVVALLTAFAFYQEPDQGDLTRIGGLTENAYGWTAPQKRFEPPLVATQYDRPFDVVVLGDSYSVNPGGQTPHGAFWTNFVAQQTGLSVVALSLHDVSVRALLDHPVFRRSPPRMVILQIVERYVIRNVMLEERWMGGDFPGCPSPTAPQPVRTRHALDAAPVPWQRDTQLEFDLDQSFDTLWKSAWRLAGFNATRVENVPLTTPALFSSRTGNRMLLYDDEFRLGDWPRAEIEQALCRLRAIQEQIQGNGQTAFLFMAVPNKLSAYADFVTERRFGGLQNLPALLADHRLNQVNLLDPLRHAVRCGVVDVYMPNDTHWGTPGNQIAAKAALAAMARQPQQSGPSC